MKIKMLQTVREDWPFSSQKPSVLFEGKEYEAMMDKNGSIVGFCKNGFCLDVKTNEFEFVDFPFISSEFDLNNLIKYFEFRQKSMVELADKEDPHWYEMADTFYRGFYDALDDCLIWLNKQKEYRRNL